MCAGRVDKDFVLEAFRQGAAMVMVGACHLPFDCHYISGNVQMTKRMEALSKVLQKMGMSKERLRVEYISAAEGVKFAQVMKEMTEQIQALDPEKIKAENEKMRPKLEMMLSRNKNS